MARLTESDIESAVIAWRDAIGGWIAYGFAVSPDGDTLTWGLSRKGEEK